MSGSFVKTYFQDFLDSLFACATRMEAKADDVEFFATGAEFVESFAACNDEAGIIAILQKVCGSGLSHVCVRPVPHAAVQLRSTPDRLPDIVAEGVAPSHPRVPLLSPCAVRSSFSLSRVLYNTITPYATLVCILLLCRVLTFFSLSLSLSQLSLSIDNQAITVSKDEVVKACKDKKHGEDGVWTREVAKHFGPCLKKFAGMTSLEKYVAPTKTSHMLDCTIVKECKDYTVSNNGWTVRGNE